MAGQPKSTRSGGPKTRVGKAIASQNSIKAGAYSRVDILPHKDALEHAALAQLFVDDLRSVGVVECALVQSLVKITWKTSTLKNGGPCFSKLPSLSDLQKAGIDNYPASSESYVANPELIFA